VIGEKAARSNMIIKPEPHNDVVPDMTRIFYIEIKHGVGRGGWGLH
jgi:hypothetical protein